MFSGLFGHLPWLYVNSINWSVWEGEEVMGVWLSLGTPSMHSMSSLNLVRQ